jgi:hypothetical protein
VSIALVSILTTSSPCFSTRIASCEEWARHECLLNRRERGAHVIHELGNFGDRLLQVQKLVMSALHRAVNGDGLAAGRTEELNT